MKFTNMKNFNIFTNVIVLLLILLLEPSTPYSQTSRCPPVFYEYPLKYHDNHCYQFVPVEMYWTHADSFCKNEGGRLVKITDGKLNQYIVDNLNSMQWWTNNGVWIGLNDLKEDGKWVWPNKYGYDEPHSVDSGNFPYDFNNWGSGQPNGWFSGWRKCVRMVRGTGDWLWYETTCYSYPWQYRFICQFHALPKPTQPPPLPTAQPSIQKAGTDLKFENLKIVAQTSTVEHKEEEHKPSYHTRTIILSCLLSILFVVLVILLLKFRTLKRKQRLMMGVLFKGRGEKKGGGGDDGGGEAVGGLKGDVGRAEGGFLKLASGDGMRANLGSVNVGVWGVMGDVERCENNYVDEKMQKQIKMDENDAGLRRNGSFLGVNDEGEKDEKENIYEELPFKISSGDEGQY